MQLLNVGNKKAFNLCYVTLHSIKTCTTSWLMHAESYLRIISRFQPLIDALDVIFFERGEAEAKWVRDHFLEPNLLLMLLSLAEVLNLSNVLSKYLQTSAVVYTWFIVKVNGLNKKLHMIKDSLPCSQVADSKLKFFNKDVSLH